MMTVNIPLNDYKPVINEKNVQYICDAFLNQGSGCAFNDYVIGYDNCVRLANGTRAYGFGNTTNAKVYVHGDCQDKNYELTEIGWDPFKRKIVIKIWD